MLLVLRHISIHAGILWEISAGKIYAFNP